MQIEIEDKLIKGLTSYRKRNRIAVPKNEKKWNKEINTLLSNALYDLTHAKEVESITSKDEYSFGEDEDISSVLKENY